MAYDNNGCVGGYGYPYNNSTQPNLDWTLQQIKDLQTTTATQATQIADLQTRVTALEQKG